MKEEWKPIIGYENIYEISSRSRIRSVDRIIKHSKGPGCRFLKGKIIKPVVSVLGYSFVTLSKNGKTKTFRWHRIVALTFIPNPNNLPQVNHIDGIKTNNKISNLEWCSSKHNVHHAFETGLNGSDRMKKRKVMDCRGNKFNSILEAAEKYNIRSPSSIGMACKNKIYHSSGKYADGTPIKWVYLD